MFPSQIHALAEPRSPRTGDFLFAGMRIAVATRTAGSDYPRFEKKKKKKKRERKGMPF